MILILILNSLDPLAFAHMWLIIQIVGLLQGMKFGRVWPCALGVE